MESPAFFDASRDGVAAAIGAAENGREQVRQQSDADKDDPYKRIRFVPIRRSA